MKMFQCELNDYYKNFCNGKMEETLPKADREARQQIITGIESFYERNPDVHPATLKATLHELIAEKFVPKIFDNSPFFFEMGMRPAEIWGIPMSTFEQPASWMHNFMLPKYCDNKPAENFYSYALHCPQSKIKLWNGRLGFDEDHHCIGYSKLLKCGMNGILKEIEERMKHECSQDQRVELDAMERSCKAFLKVADRFRQEAHILLETASDEIAIKNYRMIIDAASHIPAEPPRSFYEGLAMLWFLREVMASLEGIGISVIGHPDRQLIDLYRHDICNGVLTESEAAELIAVWMMPNDAKTFAREREWPETSTCMMLGGCDENGTPVWNELTRLFIEIHCDNHMINPKLNCRYSSKSPQEYLQLISAKTIEGYNNFALINDDVLIPALMKYGKTEEDARLYVNGGCQETICEGVEHSAGAYYYFNMAELFNLFFTGRTDGNDELLPTAPVDADSFNSFYQQYIDALKNAVYKGAEWSAYNGRLFPQINPCPLFSTTLEGCIENATDYKSGGAKYNLSGVTLVGLGDVVNSLYAVKSMVFDKKQVTLKQLQQVIQDNWHDAESLRQQILSLPRFGQGQDDINELASMFASDTAEFVRQMPNERGEYFQPSFFVYWTFKHFGDKTGATPDGRFKGDMLCQGIAPSRIKAPDSLTGVIRSLSNIDFRDYPGNAVLDLQLPAGRNIPAETLCSVIRTAATAGIPTLQFNCVNPDVLKKAQVDPDKYSDIIVRISGLSAVFVQLRKEVQDEIISRAVYAA